MAQMIAPQIADDFDGDGLEDWVFSPPGRRASAWMSETGWMSPREVELPALTTALLSQDLDADGWPELVALSSLMGPSTAFKWDGSDFSEVKFPFPWLDRAVGPEGMVTGAVRVDLDGDGRDEIVVSAWKDAASSVRGWSGIHVYQQNEGVWLDTTNEWIHPDDADISVFAIVPVLRALDERLFLLVVADFDMSALLEVVDGRLTVSRVSSELDDENGMGSLLHDFDNNGVLDWLVTSVFADVSSCSSLPPATGCSGNRVYSLDLAGETVTDVTSEHCLTDGGWGWGASTSRRSDSRLAVLTVAGMHMPEDGQDKTDYLGALLATAESNEEGDLGGVYVWRPPAVAGCWTRETVAAAGAGSYRSVLRVPTPEGRLQLQLGQAFGGVSVVEEEPWKAIALAATDLYRPVTLLADHELEGFPCGFDQERTSVSGGVSFSAVGPTILELVPVGECDRAAVDSWAAANGWRLITRDWWRVAAVPDR